MRVEIDVPGYSYAAHMNACARAVVLGALLASNGRMTKAAKLLGRNRTELYRCMKRLGVTHTEVKKTLAMGVDL